MGLLVVDNEYLPVAQALVEQAKKEICISSFKLEISEKPRGRDLKKFFDTIITKIRSGVKVKVLFNWHDDRRSVPKTNYYASTFLKSQGVDVRFLKNNRCVHAKLLMIDKEKILLGSHNLSIRSTQANFELSYLIPDPETVAQAALVFEHSFNDAKSI
jgi:phosphatidylserine/phosphatidylglycerophosphate/cardiolipin synthase-like enzyme